MLQNPWIQLVFLLLAVWMTLQLCLQHLGAWSVLLASLLAGLLAATVYLLRFDRPRMAAIYVRPCLRPWIVWVCWVTSQQPPVDSAQVAQAEEPIALREPRDFQWAAQKLREAVIGQDAAVSVILRRLQESVALRRRSFRRTTIPPLGVFLLAGAEGIGKRTLACRLGQLLYARAHATVLRMDDYRQDASAVPALFGSTGQEGHLLGPVKARPYQTIVLENIEQASPRVLEQLQGIFARGNWPDRVHGTPVSFQHCLFVLTTTRVPPGLDRDKQAQLGAEQWQKCLLEALAAGTGLNPPFLGKMQEVLLLDPPDERTRARVICRLMQEECRKYGITLDFVAPEIVADEVIAYSDCHGFQWSESRVAKRLREALVLAAEHNLDRLVITREMLGDSRPLAPVGWSAPSREAG